MRLRTHQQLFLSYLVLIAALTATISVGTGSVLRRHLMQTIETDLRRELALARSMYEALPELPPDSLADLLGALSGRRATIISPAGRAIGESAVVVSEVPPDSDYMRRPEVRAALEAGEGRAVRRSATLGVDHLYLATVTTRGDIVRLAVPLAEINAALADVQRRIVFVGVVAIVFAAFFSLGFTVLVTRPLRRTVDAARALGAGNLSRRVEVVRDDEFGELGTALNTLADELQRRLSQLEGERAETQALIDSMAEGVLAVNAGGAVRRANPAARRMFAIPAASAGIPPEMVSRRPEFLALVNRATRGEAVGPVELGSDGHALLATAQPLPQGGAVLVFLDISELRRLEGVRRDFVANASHELKTPLTAIRGYSETLLDPDLPPELRSRFTEIVRSNAERLQRIIDDLLDLSRIEAGAWRIEPRVIDVRELAGEVWRTQAPDGPDCRPRLELAIAPPHDLLWADGGTLRQIFSNLFSNAIRYTAPGGVVTVRARGAGSRPGNPARLAVAPEVLDWTIVEVADTGSGIPAAHIGRIFERFYRVDPARSREEGGTGLGLAIVKHLVEAHGGWIEADSTLGEGTTIRFALPSAAGETGTPSERQPA